MEPAEAARSALDFIRDKLLLALAMPLTELTPAIIWRWRHNAHALRIFAAPTLSSAVSEQTENLLATSAGLWRLLADNADALEEIKDYEWARKLSAASDLASISEEIASGEDQTVRDVALDALTFFLNWKSNTVWVDAGKKSHRAMARGYLLEIQEELWEFLQQSSDTSPSDMTLERAVQVGSRADELISQLANEDTPTTVQAALLAFLYQWILRLRMGRLLVGLEAIAHPSAEPPASSVEG